VEGRDNLWDHSGIVPEAFHWPGAVGKKTNGLGDGVQKSKHKKTPRTGSMERKGGRSPTRGTIHVRLGATI